MAYDTDGKNDDNFSDVVLMIATGVLLGAGLLSAVFMTLVALEVWLTLMH